MSYSQISNVQQHEECDSLNVYFIYMIAIGACTKTIFTYCTHNLYYTQNFSVSNECNSCYKYNTLMIQIIKILCKYALLYVRQYIRTLFKLSLFA